MRKFEEVIQNLKKTRDRSYAALPMGLQKILSRNKALESPQRFARALKSNQFKAFFTENEGSLDMRVNLYIISGMIKHIADIDNLISEYGGVSTYDQIRARAKVIRDAPDGGKRDLSSLLERFNQLRKRLDQYADYQTSELPEDLQKEIRSLPVIPSFTSGGVESVNSIKRILVFAETTLKDVQDEE